MQSIISVKGLSKNYNELKAVDNISFQVEQGSLFAFLGENGAGKSTTINILCTILEKNTGKVNICGYDLDSKQEKIKSCLGIVFQNSVLDQSLSVKDNLLSRIALYGVGGKAAKLRIAELSKMFDLDDIMKRPFCKLSGGQRRRVDIARALLGHPKILFLDEPTTGLDPNSRRMVWNIVEELRREDGLTVFLTTHYMEEAARADKVVILDHGKIAAEGSPDSLKSRFAADALRVIVPESNRMNTLFSYFELKYRYENNAYRVEMHGRAAVEFLSAHPEIKDFEFVKGTMDDVFLNATGKKMEVV